MFSWVFTKILITIFLWVSIIFFNYNNDDALKNVFCILLIDSSQVFTYAHYSKIYLSAASIGYVKKPKRGLVLKKQIVLCDIKFRYSEISGGGLWRRRLEADMSMMNLDPWKVPFSISVYNVYKAQRSHAGARYVRKQCLFI